MAIIRDVRVTVAALFAAIALLVYIAAQVVTINEPESVIGETTTQESVADLESLPFPVSPIATVGGF